MFSFFSNKPSGIDYPIKKYYKFEYIKRRYLFEVNKIKDYYRNRDRAVNNSHILAKLITTLAPNYNSDTFEYFKIVDINSRLISRQYNIVSNINKNKVLDNELYGNNSSEVLLYTTSDINFDTIKYTWKEESPLRCVYTTSTGINFSFPYQNVSLPKPTYSVFEIDVNLMLIMYKYWCIERVSNDASINPNVFVATYVLTNTIDSMLDMSILNRLLAISNGIKISQEIFNPHPFTILNYSAGIDDILKSVLRDVRGEKIYIEQLLLSIPTITHDNMLDVVRLTNNYYTRQSKWVLWSSRMRIIRQLLYILGKKGRNMNRDYTNRLPFTLKVIKNRQSDIEVALPDFMYEEFTNEMDKIKRLLKR